MKNRYKMKNIERDPWRKERSKNSLRRAMANITGDLEEKQLAWKRNRYMRNIYIL